MKYLIFILVIGMAGCQSANKASPQLKVLPDLPKYSYPAASIGGYCPVSEMDEFHRNLFLQTKGRMSH
jgi:hypothetical protein